MIGAVGQRAPMQIHFLNHASLIIRSEDTRLLIDPWFFGYAFGEGWGLKFDNPHVLEHVKGCTHLWVSHFHSDHFHPPTLKKVLEVNPSIIAVGNHSLNFQLDDALGRLGFKSILSLGEREWLSLGPRISIIRYPATGIDNMLLVRTPEATVLNYNDCVLPDLSMKLLARKLGKIDVLCVNFNHAGKILQYPLSAPEAIRSACRETFRTTISVFNPRHIVAFASYHYYRAPESVAQNESLLGLDDLLAIDPRILPLTIGEAVALEHGRSEISHCDRRVAARALDRKERNAPRLPEALGQASREYCRKFRSRFPLLWRFIPDFLVTAHDLGRTFRMSLRSGLQEVGSDEPAHIAAHSEEIYKWLADPYGSNTFLIGAHLEIRRPDFAPFKWHFVAAVAMENKLDLRSVIRMVLTPRGICFLLHRREEALGILLGGSRFLSKKSGTPKAVPEAPPPAIEGHASKGQRT